jgi:DNA gyrase subunit B
VANYGNESMRTQSDLEAMRMYPNNFLGSDSLDGATQTIKEILSNSVDEANSGYGQEINLIIDENGAVTVEDFGRGLPMDFNKKEDMFNWEIAFCTLHGGGKFKDDRSSYNSSSGQHGIGAAAMQLSSEFCDVFVKRDGFIYEMHFKKGSPIGNLKKKRDQDKPQSTGTIITWKPDLEVFTEVDFDLDIIKEWVKLQSIVNGGIKFNLVDKRANFQEEFFYENGIIDYAKENLGSNNLSDLIYFECSGKGRDTVKRHPYEVNGKVLFAFTDKPETLYFHNSIPLEYGGSPKKAMEDAFTQFFTDQLKKDNKLKGELKFEDIKDNLLFVSATTTQIPPSFENQTKKAISNKFIQEFLTGQILLQLENWSKESPMEFEKVRNQISINNESRLTAAAHRALTRQKLTKNIGGMKNKIDNFVDCRTKDVTKREIYVCEGLSALGSLKQARNPEYQALFPIRGKIKSVYKIKPSDALASETVKNIIQLVGTGINSKTTKCNIDELRFEKIIFAHDQDIDGLHIASLLLTLFYTFMPEVIQNGNVYSLQTPLYEITYKDGNKVFAYSDQEMIDLTRDKPCKISRNKGLGEIDAQDMKLCLDPKTQHLIQYTMEDAEHAAYFIDLFMGADPAVRKEYIAENMHNYELEDIDQE